MNSASPRPTIKFWLDCATNRLKKATIGTPRLDTEVILAHILKRPRIYLHAHPEKTLSIFQVKKANLLLEKRLSHQPIAYLTRQKEFYRRNFIVTPSVLIPRPTSETIIEELKKIVKLNKHEVLYDIGTGSGILGITAKLELPNLNVTLSDISHSALLVARRNAKLLKSDVKITSSNLLTNLPPNPDLIIANLPYVDSSWMRSPETNFEPKIALFADEGGLEIIQKLIDQASTKIAPSGYLLLEADPAQHEQIHQYSLKKQFVLIKTIDYVVILQKA